MAAQEGFDYSQAMRRFAERQGAWTGELLERSVAAPEQLVPGTEMSAMPILDAAERADLIAYLQASR